MATENKPESATSSFAPFGESLPSAITRAAKAPKAKSKLRWQILRVGALVAVLFGICAAMAGYLWLKELNIFTVDTTRIDSISKAHAADNSLVFDRNGEKIGEYFNSYHVFVPFQKLPKDMVDAIVAIEDRTFWTHAGYDPKAIFRAAYAKLKGQNGVQGASTLTQQIVRNFLLPHERTMQRKIQEVALAMQLEKRMPKQKLFEIYANSLFLGNGSYGVGAAAYRYFGKSVGELEIQEAALIAGLFQSPSRYNPTRYPKRAKRRQEQVLRAMYKAGYLSFAKAKQLMAMPLEYKEYKPINTTISPYFVDFVKEQAQKLLADSKVNVNGQGLRIYTTIDPALQRLAEKSIADSGKLLDQAQERTAPLKSSDGKTHRATLETAILSTDPRTGEILAMVGGRDYNRTKYNRTYQSMRSPGSAFKPVIYSLALASKWKWSDVIFVSPITINNYRPHTPDEDFLTETTLLRAFFRSMNTPTVELGQKLGLRPVLEQAQKLGIRSPIKEEFGSMLGSSEVTMTDMSRMYSTFANSGRLVEQTAITKIVDQKGKVLYKVKPVAERSTQVITPQVAFLTTQGMRAVLQMGTGFTAAHLANVAAGKTGTSNDSTDNWFCGYSPNLTTIVWVGTDEHAQIYGDVTGGKLALPIWDKFMTKAFEIRRPAPFAAPSGIVTTTVHPKFGNRSPAGVRMYFLRGNEPPEEAESSALEVLSQSSSGGYRDVFAH